jgi:hypothetical protein
MPIARGRHRGHPEVEIGLADDAEQTQVLDALDVPHHVDDLVALASSSFKSSP